MASTYIFRQEEERDKSFRPTIMTSGGVITRKFFSRVQSCVQSSCQRDLHVTSVCQKVQAGRYKRSQKGDRPLTYEMANPPHYIAHRKAWNSWNTSNLQGGIRPAETAVEDIFIRRFMTGTWHSLFSSEVIIKRQHNMIRVGGLVRQQIGTRKMYFLIGYCEELLSFWLQCPVKLELQIIADKNDAVFKYI